MHIKAGYRKSQAKAQLLGVLLVCIFVVMISNLDGIIGSFADGPEVKAPPPVKTAAGAPKYEGPSGPVILGIPEYAQYHSQPIADPFTPYASSRRALPAAPARESRHPLLPASLLMGTAACCLWMIRLKRRWQVARRHGRMAAKLSWALKKGMLQLSDLALLRNKRSATRYPFQAKSRIWWKGRLLKHSVRAVCVDVSEGGVGVLASGAAPMHARVFVQLQPSGRVREAVVRHCETRGSEYFVGLKFTDAVVAAA